MNIRVWAIIAAIWTTLTLTYGSTDAQDGISILDSDVSYVFGRQIEFTLSAISSAPITSARLTFWARSDAEGKLCEPQFEPATSIHIYCVMDVTDLDLTPFTLAGYSWEVRDSIGRRLETEPARFRYEDNRFDWEIHIRDSIRVHSADVGPDVVEAVLAAAIRAADELDRQLGISDSGQIDIYLYKSTFALRSGLELPGSEIMSAYADPEGGVIAISVDGNDADGWRRTLPHEMTHVWLYRATNGADMPLWLNEGYAMTMEPEPDPYMDALVEDASSDDDLIPLASLCSGFPSDRDELYLAYAQSNSLVRYIRDRYGQDAIRSLLAAYSDGATCEGGVQMALGLSLEEIERGWHLSLYKASGNAGNRHQIISWLALLILTSIAMGVGYLYSGLGERKR